MKKILLKLAHYIINKYEAVPLDLKTRIQFNGMVFEIQNYTLSQDFFKTTLTIEACDCLSMLDRCRR